MLSIDNAGGDNARDGVVCDYRYIDDDNNDGYDHALKCGGAFIQFIV